MLQTWNLSNVLHQAVRSRKFSILPEICVNHNMFGKKRECRMFYSSILDNLSLFLQIPTQVQSHSNCFGKITPEFGKFHWKVPFVTNSTSYWFYKVTEKYLLVGEIKNEDPKVECEPSKPNDKEVATGNLENLKR